MYKKFGKKLNEIWFIFNLILKCQKPNRYLKKKNRFIQCCNLQVSIVSKEHFAAFEWKMGRKKAAKDPQEEQEAESKLLIDEASNLMKMHNYTKALTIYKKVKHNLRLCFPKASFWSLNFSLCIRSFSNSSPEKLFSVFFFFRRLFGLSYLYLKGRKGGRGKCWLYDYCNSCTKIK